MPKRKGSDRVRRRRKHQRERGNTTAAAAVEGKLPSQDAKNFTPPGLFSGLRDSISTLGRAGHSGAVDSSTAHPDFLKYEFATFINETAPGKQKMQQLIASYTRGKLRQLPEIDHWAMEAFFWKGLPGDSWHPIDAFLRHRGDQLSVKGKEQLRRWKDAELGFYEIGNVQRDMVELRAYDVVADRPQGSWVKSIDLGIGGARNYRDATGSLLLTWVAPWSPEDNLFCAMGYGGLIEKSAAANYYLNSQTGDTAWASSVWPWSWNAKAVREYVKRWKRREWQSWFESRVTLPFEAVIMIPEGSVFETLCELMPSDPARAREFGIYFGTAEREVPMVTGATSIFPVDVRSPECEAFAEYRAYRDYAGPPPATKNHPSFMEDDL